MILSLVSQEVNLKDNFVEFKKVMVLLEKAGKDKDNRLASSLTK